MPDSCQQKSAPRHSLFQGTRSNQRLHLHDPARREPGQLQIVEKGPDLDKDGVMRWRRVDLVQQSAAHFGVPEVHPSTMGKWLQRLGLTKLTTRPHHPKKDEAAQQAFKENFKDIVNEKLPAEVKENGNPVEFWFQDEARVGQQGTLSRVWAPIGSRPAMVRDNRRANAYIYRCHMSEPRHRRCSCHGERQHRSHE